MYNYGTQEPELVKIGRICKNISESFIIRHMQKLEVNA